MLTQFFEVRKKFVIWKSFFLEISFEKFDCNGIFKLKLFLDHNLLFDCCCWTREGGSNWQFCFWNSTATAPFFRIFSMEAIEILKIWNKNSWLKNKIILLETVQKNLWNYFLKIFSIFHSVICSFNYKEIHFIISWNHFYFVDEIFADLSHLNIEHSFLLYND